MVSAAPSWNSLPSTARTRNRTSIRRPQRTRSKVMRPLASSVADDASFSPSTANSTAPVGSFQTNECGKRTVGRRLTSATTASICQNGRSRPPARMCTARRCTSCSHGPHHTRRSCATGAAEPSARVRATVLLILRSAAATAGNAAEAASAMRRTRRTRTVISDHAAACEPPDRSIHHSAAASSAAVAQ
jgi:hypothetical protein